MKLQDLSVKKLHAVWDALTEQEARPTGKKPEILAVMIERFGEEVDDDLLEPKEEFSPEALLSSPVAKSEHVESKVPVVALVEFKRTFGWTVYDMKPGDSALMDEGHARALKVLKLVAIK